VKIQFSALTSSRRNMS